MTNSLDFTRNDFEQLLNRSQEMILNQFESLEEKPAYHPHAQKEVAKWFEEPLPKEGMDVSTLMDTVQSKVMDTATNNLGP